MPFNSTRNADILKLGDTLYQVLPTGDHSYKLKTYPKTFVASDAVAAMQKAGIASGPEEAVFIGQELVESGVIIHAVDDEKRFANDFLFFRFVRDDQLLEDHQRTKRRIGLKALSPVLARGSSTTSPKHGTGSPQASKKASPKDSSGSGSPKKA
mmetsp:Transcript_19504/g.51871  ORF Transcript_19504/g.51871 Transcript_19504/m.51871 type:complete len:154 (-) Transcript_19504:399-860(-)